MALNRYTVKYFSRKDDAHWMHYHYDVLAETEAQVRDQVDQRCEQHYRLRDSVYPEGHPDYHPPKDSLEIDCYGPVELPYILL